MTTPTTPAAVPPDEDPLAQAMSMLDDDGADFDAFDDFAIDSDDEGVGDTEEVDLNELDANFDDIVDLNGAGSNEMNGGPQGNAAQLCSEIDGPRNKLQGNVTADAVKTDAGSAPSAAAAATTAPATVGSPPTHWATKQDVAEMTSSGGDAVNSTTATSLKTPKSAAAATATAPAATQHHPLAHPLQDLPTAPSSGGAGGSWTSSFASFAKQAAASVQTVVENAEQAVLHSGVGGSGGAPVGQYPQNAPLGGIRMAQNSHMQQQQRNQQQHQRQQFQQKQQQQQITSPTPSVVGVQGGAPTTQPMTSKSIVMSYQERQKMLHQQHHAKHGGGATPTGAGPTAAASLQKPPTPRASPATVATAAATATAGKLTPSPSPVTTPPSPPKTDPTFLDKLTTSLDTPTKTKLVASALGTLLPGERVIMFLNALKDVRDSSFAHVFVGSEDWLEEKGLHGVLGEGEGSSDGHGESGEITTVWCCVMTFYRVAVFSYQATRDGKVLLDDEEGKAASSAKESSNGKDSVVQQWIHSQNVSIQFQTAHCPPAPSSNDDNQSKQKHHVFQMPLASIERVEKTLASSQKSVGTGINPSSTSNGYSYASGYNAILPSSSTASSAMSSLGSQMKPLLGMPSSSSHNNLLTNGGGSGTNLASGASTPTGPLGIILHGKDGGRWIRFSTSNYGDSKRAQEALNTYAFPGRRNLGYLFAFESRRAEVMGNNAPQGQEPPPQRLGASAEGGGNPIATAAKPTRRRFVPLEEYERQGIFQSSGGGSLGSNGATMTSSSPWAPIVNANANYGLCSTYPSVLVGPRSIVGGGEGDGPGNVGLLRRCAAFRSENRFPALTWGNPNHGGSMWRSSQPKVGLQGNRSVEDERYLYAIGEEAKRANLSADARAEGGVGGGTSSGRPPLEFLRMLCGRNNESDLLGEGVSSGCMLKIMDMRPKSAAMGNRTQGYGYENTSNYRGSTINFYGIGNIHAVRDAYQKVNALCHSPGTSDLQWMQLVENTNWPSMIRLILSAAWQTAFHVHYNRLPVLVHCSHGWDRTSQVPALAQLLLDPHYRTREGFSTLVEKDFLSFGHPFHTRCGHGEGRNEQGGGDEGQLSPIFLQFIDCVFQLVNQFPDYFEFNTRYLLLLSENIYSCRFGTLLCDSEREREVVAGIRQRTYCMWEYLDAIPELVNPMFDKATSEKAGVLMMPLPMLLRNVTLWTDRYCMYGSKATMPCVPPSLQHAYPPLYIARYPTEQPLVLQTIRNGFEGMLQRALEDVDMWKGTAMTALKEAKELKEKQKGSEKTVQEDEDAS